MHGTNAMYRPDIGGIFASMAKPRPVVEGKRQKYIRRQVEVHGSTLNVE